MRKRIGDVLLERGLVTEEKLNAALAEQKVTKARLGRILVRNGFVRQRDLISALRETNPDVLHEESVFVPDIPPRILIETKSMVVADLPDQIYVATLTNPAIVKLRLKPYLAGRDIVFTPVMTPRLEAYLEKLSLMEADNGSVWEKLIRDALNKKASDIHIIPRHHSYTVMMRKHGVLGIAHEGELDEYVSLIARLKDRSRMDMAERRRPQDGGFSVEHNGRLIDLRVVALPTVDGERVVIRLLDPDSVNPSLSDLGITEVAQWRKAVSRPEGLCLICGPTGSGKTTTLNATLREMNFLERAVYSAEDPVEYRLAYAGQVNINHAVGLDFASSIKTFMRADPDVIVVGEVRDVDTARNALKAAETGHLVIATLHTGSIIGAVSRLKDIGVEPYELRHLLRGVMVQRLVRSLCKNCHGQGCEVCESSGYGGRTIVSEAAYFPDEMSVDKVIAGQVSWPTIIDDAMSKARSGESDIKEIKRVFGAEVKDMDLQL